MKSIQSRRPGFTLVELLVVIAIIAILIALLTGGIIMLLGKGPEMVTRNDILQLNQGVQDFYAKYKFYPPETVKLCMNRNQYVADNGGINDQSVQALVRRFPQLDSFWTNVQWAGPGNVLPATGVTLEGDQALVFWLGGPPATSNPPTLMGGFSTIPTDPIDIANSKERVKHYTFDTGRLKLVPRVGNTAASLFPSYLDGYRKGPYVYFSSHGRANGYTTAIPGNTLGVSPYKETATAYYKSTEFQLIAPGLDGLFGSGGQWPPADGVPDSTT